jgi:hypothetical protein
MGSVFKKVVSMFLFEMLTLSAFSNPSPGRDTKNQVLITIYEGL